MTTFAELEISARFRSDGRLFEKFDDRLAAEIRVADDGTIDAMTAITFLPEELVEPVLMDEKD